MSKIVSRRTDWGDIIAEDELIRSENLRRYYFYQ